MLVKVIDTKGKERFVNAMYIRSVLPKGLNRSEIDFGGLGTRIRVDQPAESVAEIINASMPSSYEAMMAAELIAAEQQNETQQNAAVIAVIG